MTKSSALRAATLLGLRGEEEDNDDDKPGVFAMSIRLPSSVACRVAVMADLARCSRNEMINLIVQAGLDEILSATSEDILLEIHEGVEFQLQDFIS